MTTRRTILFDGLALGSSGLPGARLFAAPGLARASDESPLAIAVLGATGRTGKQPPHAGVMRNIRVRPL